jgi:hypothetical protein
MALYRVKVPATLMGDHKTTDFEITSDFFTCTLDVEKSLLESNTEKACPSPSENLPSKPELPSTFLRSKN